MNYNVGLYIRLSQEDKDKKYEQESESIINQRNLILRYIHENNLNIYNEYIDDGYTGTNFDRPGFQKMIKDIEDNKINCVITKDLSRLGRDYIKCGYYIEQYFPMKKVRYISILDQIDTFSDNANNDIAPLKSLLNDMISKDTSKKIRSILRNKKEQGKFIGSRACYGYKRDPNDKGHLIIDDNVSEYVRNIFNWYSQGILLSDICYRLNKIKAPTPSFYKGMTNNNNWTTSSVKNILKNRIYVGDMVQNVQAKLSYKSQKKVKLDKSMWIIVENTHEPIIDKKTFVSIQNRFKCQIRTVTKRERRLLEGLLFCKECGSPLSVICNNKYKYWSVNCNKYSRSPRQNLCTSHFVPYDVLEKEILNRVKVTVKSYINLLDYKNIVDKLLKKNSNFYKSKILELERQIDVLYDDRTKGVISFELFIKKKKEYENSISDIRRLINNIGSNININKLKTVLDLDNISIGLLHILVDKILIDNKRNVLIKYNFCK